MINNWNKLKELENRNHMTMEQNERKTLTFTEFAESSTVHGLNKTCDDTSHKAIRLLWFLLFLTMIGLYLFISITSFQSYYRYDSVTTLSKTTKGKLEFPAVSICFQSMFTKSIFRNYPETEYWMHYLETRPFSNLTEAEAHNATYALNWIAVVAGFLTNPLDLIERCEFNSEEIDCAEHFKMDFSEAGTCITFMHADVRARIGPRYSRTPGYVHGLSK